MNKTMQQLTEIKLVSITAHTSNTREMNPDTGKNRCHHHDQFAGYALPFKL